MAEKIFATHSREVAQSGDFAVVDVDQVVLASNTPRVLSDAASLGLGKVAAELAVAYDSRCVDGEGTPLPERAGQAQGLLVGRSGVGFPAPVHLERFAGPSKLCVTDEPRLAGVGGAGMLTFVMPPAALAQALVRGNVQVRRPVSVQILLSGRLRPFVCASDAALELVRRGVGDVVRRVEQARGAPVVLEFAGQSVRGLSVGERSVLSGMAPALGATAAVFVGDERTEVFLRDQRRSKAHRTLAPDAGAPYEEVVGLDLGAVDPLLRDEAGAVRPVRDRIGECVTQVLLGGDHGATLRDLFAAAMFLKSKRVPDHLDFLLAVPSRQMLEVLSRAGALADLIATGARLVEPDGRVASGELYPPSLRGVAVRTCAGAPAVVASAETLAYCVATGEVGDPRAFKRPVRVTVPRAMPTEDVLVVRKAPRIPPPRPAIAPAAGTASAGTDGLSRPGRSTGLARAGIPDPRLRAAQR
jgi:aconitate hydratase